MTYGAPLGKKPTACVPCHRRKVRCDLPTAGLPCTHCNTRNRGDACVPLSHGSNQDKADGSNHGNGSHRNKRRRVSDGHDQCHDESLPTPNSHLHEPITTQSTSASSLVAGHADVHAHRSLRDHPARLASEAGSAQDIGERSSVSSSQSARNVAQPSTGGSGIQFMASEEDAHWQTLCLMSDVDPGVPSRMSLAGTDQGQQVFEYYTELNSIALLGEVIGQSPRHLVRINLPDLVAAGARERELSCLSDVDVEYLNAKRVHEFPPTNTCRAFFQLFFQYIYPLAPIFHRQKFLEAYDQGNCSSFLLWSILASVSPHASLALLQDAGFSECSVAQKDFFSKARLLFDFGCEKEQLSLLQGSILLSSFHCSFAPNKDFRFWFQNAIRIATQMGFHRE
ncbi:hypothetical protein NW759_014999 [Fusarium solani]|nr:hypothetical protein NW759_014999 [Fusarium solani]